MTDKYKELRKYYQGYGVYNRNGKLVRISTMSDEGFSKFQKDLETSRKNSLQGK